MYILGVTGNIGSGKSTVSQRLGEHGALISHSDDLAKFLLENDADILNQLSQRFGSDILNESGKLQRRILAERAFSDKENQQFLNQLIHPRVWDATQKRITVARDKGLALFVIDAPLLFEAGVDAFTDSVLVVAAKDELRRDRIYSRSKISAEDFAKRDRLQLPIEEKIQQADHVIYNNGSLEELISKVDDLYKRLIA